MIPSGSLRLYWASCSTDPRRRSANTSRTSSRRANAADSKTYDVAHYNLEAILAVGFRVKSPRGTQFRRWANTQLRELIVKGFVMDDERLKNPGGWDYFDELLARIREIRASEKRFYQKIRDLFTLSSDYQTREKDKRRADIPVRHAGWKTRAPLKDLSSVARRAKGEILEEVGV